MFHVYILRSLRNGKLYVGHTDDLQRRLEEHNTGRGGQFTRQQGPWELAHSEPQPDRSAAMKRELFLKSIDGSREKKRLAGVARSQNAAYQFVTPSSLGARKSQ